MALAVAVWFLVRRRRQQESKTAGGAVVEHGPMLPSPQTGAAESPEKLAHFQIRAMNPSELGLSHGRAEMPPESAERHELPSNEHSRG